MTAQIAKHVSIQRRYLRSVDITRDLEDSEALDGYILTPSARDAAIRVAEGLVPDSRQRAFRVVGAYGSGKSAFGLFLARLLRENGNGPATRLLKDACLQPPPVSYWLPLVLVGRRVSFARDLLRSLVNSASMLDIPIALTDRARRLLEPGTGPDPLEVTALLGEVASDLRARTGAGLLIIIDEMGRFLEYAAAKASAEDPSVFQYLAERSGGRSGADLAIVGILHHGFADYVAGLGAWIEAEWSRFSARYEEIRFDNSTEQSLFMLARALAHEPLPVEINQYAEKVYSEAIERGLYLAKRQDVVGIAAGLYPLHPSAIASIASATRRFGQNERSLFSFLHSLEPDGFLRFIRETPFNANNWYRTPSVFNHLAATIAHNPTGGRYRRWPLALDALRVAADMSRPHRDVLKTVALLSVLEPVPGLTSDADTIAWCLDCSVDKVSSLLGDLRERMLISFRTHREDFCLWSNTSVDLPKWLDEAKNFVARPQRLQEVAALPQTGRPIVAHRHYHTTGTLRTFDVRLWTGESPDPCVGDGRIIVVPVHSARDRDEALETLSGVLADPLTIICFRQVSASAIEWAHELALWNWVRTNCTELRVDDLARTEVSERIAAAENALMEAVSLVGPPIGGDPDEWHVGGQPIKVADQALSSVVSGICDDVYNQTPILRNELLNRNKLTSAAASARMRLLDSMLSSEREERLGIEGTPPEFAMYLSLLRNPGIHRADRNGALAFRAPTDSHWKPAWERIAALLNEGNLVRFDSLIDELSKPPLGMRAGPSVPLIAAYIIAAGNEVAMFERDTYVPDVSIAHFMRLAKAPRNFALRSLREPGGQPGMLAALAKGIRVIGKREATIPDIAAGLYNWFNRLTPFAMQTDELSPTAVAVRDQLRRDTDPGELFFRHLPEACLRADSHSSHPKPHAQHYASILDGALYELDQAIDQLRLRAINCIVRALEATDLNSLRRDLHRDFLPHKRYLEDHRLLVFIERASRQDVSDELWLDGVAGHVIGKRPANWTDETINQLDMQARIIASSLAKWLSLIQTAQGSGRALRSVHVVGTDGRDRMVVLADRIPNQGFRSRIDAVRDFLGTNPDALEILGRLLEEYIDHYSHRSDKENQA